MPSTLVPHRFHGDLKVEWNEDVNEEVLKFIQTKMDQGVAFHILDPKSKAKKPPVMPIETIGEIKNRQVYIRDDDIKNLVESGFASIAKFSGVSELKTVGRAKTAAEAAATDTVAVPPKTGG